MNDTAKPGYRLAIGKAILRCRLRCLSGLHIGASRDILDIGGIDCPVVRDPLSREPYLPASSLRGKLRCLLERYFVFNDGHKVSGKKLELRPTGTSKVPILRHQCDNAEEARQCPICRLYGFSGKSGSHFPARLSARGDFFLTEDSRKRLEKIDTGLEMTEWKFENAIDRITSEANPRQMERVPRGAELEGSFVYDVELGVSPEEIDEDLWNLLRSCWLLTLDYLGGHGRRGYGKVGFAEMSLELVKIRKDGSWGEVETTLERIRQILERAKSDAMEEGLLDFNKLFEEESS